MGDVDFWVGLVESSVWGAIDAGLAGVGFAHRGRFPRIPQGCWEDVEKQVSGFRGQGSGNRDRGLGNESGSFALFRMTRYLARALTSGSCADACQGLGVGVVGGCG